jgi:hypothetical protein
VEEGGRVGGREGGGRAREGRRAPGGRNEAVAGGRRKGLEEKRWRRR